MCTKKEMIAKQKEYNIYCAINANNWVKSVIYQGNRIKNIDIENEKMMEEIEKNPDVILEKLHENDYILPMEEHFFAIALNKSLTYITKLKKIKKFKDDIKLILDLVCNEIGRDNITNLRSMREHDDEYIKGNGNKQEDFIATLDDFVADATSSIIISGESHLLGCKVDVIKTIKIYECIQPKIQQICEQIIYESDAD